MGLPSISLSGALPIGLYATTATLTAGPLVEGELLLPYGGLAQLDTETQEELVQFATPASKLASIDSAAAYAVLDGATKRYLVPEHGFTNEQFTKGEYAEKNRHAHVLNWDHSVVGRSGEVPYSNAGCTFLNGQVYLASQGPITSQPDRADTVTDFLEMLWAYESPTIVTLAMEKEKGDPKCAAYWEGGYQDTEGSYLSLAREEELGSAGRHRLIKRTLFLSVRGGAEREITQFHYENWPDFGVAKDELFVQLLDAIRLHHKAEEALTVHCSAGVGRTGIFIATYSLRSEIIEALDRGESLDQVVVNPVERSLEMRMYRSWYMMGETQLAAVLRCAALGL